MGWLGASAAAAEGGWHHCPGPHDPNPAAQPLPNPPRRVPNQSNSRRTRRPPPPRSSPAEIPDSCPTRRGAFRTRASADSPAGPHHQRHPQRGEPPPTQPATARAQPKQQPTHPPAPTTMVIPSRNTRLLPNPPRGVPDSDISRLTRRTQPPTKVPETDPPYPIRGFRFAQILAAYTVVQSGAWGILQGPDLGFYPNRRPPPTALCDPGHNRLGYSYETFRREGCAGG
jgi:hypothetical protein